MRVRERTECGDPLGDLVRAEPHPAFEALDEQQRFHVLRSIGDRSRWRCADEDAEDDDAWLDDKVHGEDAYDYRATGEDEPEATPPETA
ncbi:hypothetical protein [Streptomyces sp. NPDC054849]